MSLISYQDLKKLSGEEIKNLLQIFIEHGYKEKISRYFTKNVATLRDLLQEIKYETSYGVSYKELLDQIKFLLEETPSELPKLEEFDDEKTIDDAVYEERRGIGMDWNSPDEEQNIENLESLVKLRNEIDDKINDLKKEKQQVEDEIEALMNIPVSTAPVQKSHEERFKNFIEESTGGLLHGEIDESTNDEVTRYLNSHPIKYFDQDERTFGPEARSAESQGAIILFPPIDQQKFNETLRKISYKPNSLKKEDRGVSIDYYLNKINNFEFLVNTLDNIWEENKTKPFKINFDCGYIVEDTRNVTYSRTPPSDNGFGRNIPVVIKNKSDMETYKHYIYSAISEKSEMTHQNSSSRYCAIHTIQIKVARLSGTGAKVLVPGYEFLLKHRYVKVMANRFNICAFNAVMGRL